MQQIKHSAVKILSALNMHDRRARQCDKEKTRKKQGNQNKNKTIENSSDVLQPSLHSIIHANTQQNPREGITYSGCRSPIDGGLGPSPATHSRRSQAMSYMRDAKGRSSTVLCMPSLGSRCQAIMEQAWMNMNGQGKEK
jgi:hypothetical protein